MKPITLATLAQSTKQEVFDYVAHHLLTQNEKSLSKKYGSVQIGCVYRNQYNLACAAGCLIAGVEYKAYMEGISWGKLVEVKIVPSNHKELIMDLQRVHDDCEIEDWREHLSKVAKEFSLKFNQG